MDIIYSIPVGMKKLFNLVDSLSKNEKRYFKTHTKSTYALELFDLINKEKRDHALINKFSSREKNYLLNSLLRTLRDFHNEMSVNRILDNYVHEIDILINKELYPLALSRISQGDKLALRHEKVHHQVLFARFKKRIERNTGTDSVESIKEHNKKITELIELMNIDYRLSELINNYREKSFLDRRFDLEEEAQKIYTSIQPELFEKVKTNYLYARIKGFVSYDNKKLEEAYVFYKATCKKFEEKSPQLPNSTIDSYSLLNYITILHSFLAVLKDTNREKEFFEVIEILKKTIGISGKESAKSFVNMAISLTDYFLRKNQVKKGISFIAEYKKRIDSIGYEPDRMELLLFNITYLYFLEKRFREAHQHMYRYILYSYPRYKVLYKASNFIYIIIQMELNKFDFGFTLLNKFTKKLKEENQFNPFDNLIAQFLEHRFGSGSFPLAEKSYWNFVELIKSNEASKNMNSFFNFKGWMEEKLFNKPMSHN